MQAYSILLDRLHVEARIANLHDFVKISQSLVLVHLGHRQLLNEEFLNLFKLVDLLVDFLHLYISVHYSRVVTIPCLLAYKRLRLGLHVLELLLGVLDVVSHLPLTEVLVLFFSDPPLKQLFLLSHHDSFHAKCPLLLLKFILAQFLHVFMLGPEVSLSPLKLFF